MKKVIKIFLEDNMTKSVAISYDATAKKLYSILARKMKLIDTSNYRVILLTEEGEIPQRALDPDENVFQLLSNLDAKQAKYEFYFRDPLAPIRKGSIDVIPFLFLNYFFTLFYKFFLFLSLFLFPNYLFFFQ